MDLNDPAWTQSRLCSLASKTAKTISKYITILQLDKQLIRFILRTSYTTHHRRAPVPGSKTRLKLHSKARNELRILRYAVLFTFFSLLNEIKIIILCETVIYSAKIIHQTMSRHVSLIRLAKSYFTAIHQRDRRYMSRQRLKSVKHCTLVE